MGMVLQIRYDAIQYNRIRCGIAFEVLLSTSAKEAPRLMGSCCVVLFFNQTLVFLQSGCSPGNAATASCHRFVVGVGSVYGLIASVLQPGHVCRCEMTARCCQIMFMCMDVVLIWQRWFEVALRVVHFVSCMSTGLH